MATSIDLLSRLQAWYLAQCDGEWDHGHGVTIQTLDNPGWYVTISLSGTYLEGMEFPPAEVSESEHRWMTCRVREGRFEGAGGPVMLEEILRTFFAWAGVDRRQAEVILREDGPPGEVAHALLAATLGGEERAWIEGECVRHSYYPDANVRRVVALCFGHLARIHGELNLAEVEPVLAQLAADPDESVVAAAADARQDIDRYVRGAIRR